MKDDETKAKKLPPLIFKLPIAGVYCYTCGELLSNGKDHSRCR